MHSNIRLFAAYILIFILYFGCSVGIAQVPTTNDVLGKHLEPGVERFNRWMDRYIKERLNLSHDDEPTEMERKEYRNLEDSPRSTTKPPSLEDWNDVERPQPDEELEKAKEQLKEPISDSEHGTVNNPDTDPGNSDDGGVEKGSSDEKPFEHG